MNRRSPLETAEAIIQRANDGYHNQKATSYPPTRSRPGTIAFAGQTISKIVIVEVLAEGK